jgi:hypothetical protein
MPVVWALSTGSAAIRISTTLWPSFVAFLLDSYGIEAIVEFHERCGASPNTFEQSSCGLREDGRKRLGRLEGPPARTRSWCELDVERRVDLAALASAVAIALRRGGPSNRPPPLELQCS